MTVSESWAVNQYNVLPEEQLKDAWSWYTKTFEDVNRKAANRHVMFFDEFKEVMYDNAITKYVVTGEGNQIVGMSVLTNQLSHWSLLSPQYYAEKFPEHFEQERLWYIGFVGVTGGLGTFSKLIRSMHYKVHHSNGIALMDFCMYNVDTKHLPAMTLRLLKSINPAFEGRMIDEQQFWGFWFDGVER
jgi:hypothetical protein